MVNNQQIFLYNTLKNKLEPLDPSLKEIKIYVCGPTVYNHLHIGNGRIQVVYDSLVRFLKHYYPKIKYVSNITDIDDKILNKANEELKSWEEISNYYTEEFIMVLKYLNITNIDILCKATDNIDCIKDDIYNMINKGIAYSTQKGNIYFNTQIDHIKDFYTTITKNQGANENIRIVSEEEKKNPKDFALWKKNNLLFKSKQLTDGMPGWHTECSSMAKKYLGNVSIHGGGLDLLFPHHTNENIQHYGLYGEELSKIWTHVGMVTINGQKMSKSLGNIIFIKDYMNWVMQNNPNSIEKINSFKYKHNIVNNNFNNDIIKKSLRYLLLATHYRKNLDFSAGKVEESIAFILKIEFIIIHKNDNIKLLDNINDNSSSLNLENLLKDFNIPNFLGITLNPLINFLLSVIKNNNYINNMEYNKKFDLLIQYLNILGIIV